MHGETLIFVYFFNLYFELDQCGGYTLQKQFSSQAKAQVKYYLNVNLIELSYEESRLYFGHVFFLIWDKMYADFWGVDKYFYLIWTIFSKFGRNSTNFKYNSFLIPAIYVLHYQSSFSIRGCAGAWRCMVQVLAGLVLCDLSTATANFDKGRLSWMMLTEVVT